MSSILVTAWRGLLHPASHAVTPEIVSGWVTGMLPNAIREGDVFLACPPTAEDAFVAAADLAAVLRGRSGAHHVHPSLWSIAIGHGDFEGWLGPEPTRARLLANFVGLEAPICCTEAALRAVGTPPVGIGVHQGRADTVRWLGFGFHCVTDYR